MQYFVATRDGSRLGLDELLGRMERNGAKQSHISFSRGADDLIRLDAFTTTFRENVERAKLDFVVMLAGMQRVEVG